MTITIRYQTINHKGELVTKERSFPSEAAMQRWVAQQEALAEAERGGFIGILAYSRGYTKEGL